MRIAEYIERFEPLIPAQAWGIELDIGTWTWALDRARAFLAPLLEARFPHDYGKGRLLDEVGETERNALRERYATVLENPQQLIYAARAPEDILVPHVLWLPIGNRWVSVPYINVVEVGRAVRNPWTASITWEYLREEWGKFIVVFGAPELESQIRKDVEDIQRPLLWYTAIPSTPEISLRHPATWREHSDDLEVPAAEWLFFVVSLWEYLLHAGSIATQEWLRVQYGMIDAFLQSLELVAQAKVDVPALVTETRRPIESLEAALQQKEWQQ